MKFNKLLLIALMISPMLLIAKKSKKKVDKQVVKIHKRHHKFEKALKNLELAEENGTLDPKIQEKFDKANVSFTQEDKDYLDLEAQLKELKKSKASKSDKKSMKKQMASARKAAIEKHKEIKSQRKQQNKEAKAERKQLKKDASALEEYENNSY